MTLITAFASQGTQAQDTSYPIGFTPGTTCAEVYERTQREGGGDVGRPLPPAPPPGVQAPSPRAQKPPGPWGTVEAQRSFEHGVPNVRYACDGNERVRSQNVEVWFDTREAALASYASYAKQLRAGLGAPCWESDALSEEQRKLVQASDDFAVRQYQQRLEWRGPTNTQLWMMSRQASSWIVQVVTNDARFRNDDMRGAERKVRAFGTCDPVVQLPVVSDSDDAPTILTKWFAHMRERGYPAMVDFVASGEKQRLHAAVIELARRASGTPSEARVLRGLAGEEIPIDETLAALEKSTPDAWLRDLLTSKFRTPDGLIRPSQMDILGTIPEGDVTHVIARVQYESSNGPVGAVQSYDFKRSGKRMEMQLPPELQVFELGFRTVTHGLTSTP